MFEQQEKNKLSTEEVVNVLTKEKFETNDMAISKKYIEHTEVGDDHILEHPNNKALKTKDPAKYEEHKRKLEEFGDKIRTMMSNDTSFVFLKEQGLGEHEYDKKTKLMEFDISDLDKAMETFETIYYVLQISNDLFKSNLRIGTIYVTSSQGQKFGGFASGAHNEHDEQYININITEGQSHDQIASTVIHEIMHILDFDHDEDNTGWEKLGDVDMDSHGFHSGTEVYGSTNAMESKAVIGQHLFENPGAVLEAVREDATGSLKKKVEVMTGCKISEKGYYFEKTFNTKTYPQEYSKLGFNVNSYFMGWSTGKMDNTWWNNHLGYENTSPKIGEEIAIVHNSINQSLISLFDILENNPSGMTYTQLSTILDGLLYYTSNIDGKILTSNDILALQEDFGVNESLHSCFDLMTKLSIDNLGSNAGSKTHTNSNNVFLNYYYKSIGKLNANNKIFMNVLQEYVKGAKLHEFAQRAKNIWKNVGGDSMKKLATDFIIFCEHDASITKNEVIGFYNALDSTGKSILKSTLVLEHKQNTSYGKIISKL